MTTETPHRPQRSTLRRRGLALLLLVAGLAAVGCTAEDRARLQAALAQGGGTTTLTVTYQTDQASTVTAHVVNAAGADVRVAAITPNTAHVFGGLEPGGYLVDVVESGAGWSRALRSDAFTLSAGASPTLRCTAGVGCSLTARA
ncbi:MAG: hypothetical protein ACKVWR_18570 [Acidimicrobiales bacterium]